MIVEPVEPDDDSATGDSHEDKYQPSGLLTDWELSKSTKEHEQRQPHRTVSRHSFHHSFIVLTVHTGDMAIHVSSDTHESRERTQIAGRSRIILPRDVVHHCSIFQPRRDQRVGVRLHT